VTKVCCTSTSSLALARPWDEDNPLEINFKRLKMSENVEELEDSNLIISKGDILYVWGKGNSGCLGFGDLESL